MRKVITFAAAVLLAVSAARAESVDLTGMSVQELETLKARINTELESRNPAAFAEMEFTPGEALTIVQADGIKVWLTGSRRDDPYGKDIYLETVFENDSASPLRLYTVDKKLNGWNLSDMRLVSTGSGEKERTEFVLCYGDALLSSYVGMETLVFSIRADQESGESVSYGPFTLRFSFGEV